MFNAYKLSVNKNIQFVKHLAGMGHFMRSVWVYIIGMLAESKQKWLEKYKDLT